MNIKIYQIVPERDENHVAFLDYENLERFQHTAVIDCNIYGIVFEGEVDCDTLESVYRKFNLDHPVGFKGHSLSVSDIVQGDFAGSGVAQFYFCDAYGFREVMFNPDLCVTQKKPRGNPITVLLVKPGKSPVVIEMADTLESMQKQVGGYIEQYMPFEDPVAMICNEEGKMNGLPLNRAIYDSETHEMLDIIAGTFFIAYAPDDSEKFLSMPTELLEKYTKLFQRPEHFFRVGNEIAAIPYDPCDGEEKNDA